MASKGVADAAALEKWGIPLKELYRLAFSFYKQNTGKALHLTYEDNLKLIAFKQQASLGPFDNKHAPELGVLDVIGKDRRQHWQMLGDMTKEQAMEGFIDLMDNMCSAFRPYVEAVKQNRDDKLKAELKRMEEEKLEKEKKEREKQELLEEGYKEEMQRRQLQDALNKQTYHQFKAYAEKQFPGNPEQQAVLIHQLQQEHYHQYMQQLHMHNQGDTLYLANTSSSTLATTATTATTGISATGAIGATGATGATTPPSTPRNNNSNCNSNNNSSSSNSNSNNNSNSNSKNLETTEGIMDNNKLLHDTGDNNSFENDNHLDNETHHHLDQDQIANEDDENCIIIRPAKIWTRPDIDEFKAEVVACDGDGVITVGHGDTVTVRVPTNVNGKCIFWEFATDSYDIGFGVYFEWSKPVTSEVTVHVSDSDDDDDYADEDYLSTTEDLECGSTANERNVVSNNTSLKPPISIIVPIYRRECFNEVYVGSHAYPGEGVYLLKFDNSYSIWRSKTLYYRVYYER